MKKHSIYLFAALLASAVCVSCQNTEASVPAETGADPSAPETEAVTEADPADALFTQQKQDNGNKPFTILSCVVQSYEFDAEQENGEAVNDAVFFRNRAVEELLGLKLQFDFQPGNFEDKEKYFKLVSSSVMAGDKAYDLVTGMISCMVPYASSGVYTSFHDIPGLNLDAPWFVTEMNKSMTIDGKLFCYAGDMSLSMYHDISVIFANRNMLNANDLEDPYALVRDGVWTLDRLTAMCKDVGQDLNGDGKMEVTDDRFGLLYVGIRSVSLQCAFDINVIGHDGDSLVINPLSERLTTAVGKLEELFSVSGVYGDNIGDYTEYRSSFIGDRTLFLLGTMSDTEEYRDMKGDYAILPLPKYDEAQTSYRTLMPTSSQIMFVPITCDLALTGSVIDAMNYYSYKLTVPAYYDTTLSEKYSRDEQTQEMLTLIREGMTLPLDFAYGSTLGGSGQLNRITFDTAHEKKSGKLASTYEKDVKQWSKKLDKLLEEYKGE